jgi:hypothetical protein
MINVYGEDAPSYFTIKFWCKQLRWDGPRCGRPVEARTNENIKKVELLVLADRRIRVSIIADEIGISEAAVLKILHGDLGTNKVSPHWVSKLLNAEQNCVGNTFAKENFRALADDEELFRKSKIHTRDLHSQKARTQNASGKLMATIFWEMLGILLKKGPTTVIKRLYCFRTIAEFTKLSKSMK